MVFKKITNNSRNQVNNKKASYQKQRKKEVGLNLNHGAKRLKLSQGKGCWNLKVKSQRGFKSKFKTRTKATGNCFSTFERALKGTATFWDRTIKLTLRALPLRILSCLKPLSRKRWEKNEINWKSLRL
jgi:hypothetical protein